MKRLGILLTVGPESIGFSELTQWLNQRKDSKETIYFYAIDAGILALEQILRLSQSEWHVYGCAFSARHYEVSFEQEKVILCGLSVLADILGNVDEMMGVIAKEPYLIFSIAKYGFLKKRKVMIEITNDPRSNDRAWEGMRIAAGIKAWNQVELQMGFSGKGGCFLTQDNASFFEDEGLIKEVLLSNDIKFWTEAESLREQKITSQLEVETLNTAEILKRKKMVWFSLVF